LLGGGSINEQDVRGIFVYKGQDVIVGQAPADEFYFPAVTFEQVGSHLSSKFLQFVLSAADNHLFLLVGSARQLVLKLVDDCAINPGRQVLLDSGDPVSAPQLLNLGHYGPYNVSIDGVGGYSALKGLFYDSAAGWPVAPEHRLQVTCEDIVSYHCPIS
jgi:hypothetical protein